MQQAKNTTTLRACSVILIASLTLTEDGRDMKLEFKQPTPALHVCTTNSNNSYNKNNSYYYCTKVKASLFSNVDVCMVKMYANTNTNIHIVIFQPKSSPQRSANGKRCPHHPSAIGKNIALNLNRFCVSLFMEIRDGECSFLHFTFSNSHRSDDREDRRWIEE
jgi:hypothetical protein